MWLQRNCSSKDMLTLRWRTSFWPSEVSDVNLFWYQGRIVLNGPVCTVEAIISLKLLVDVNKLQNVSLCCFIQSESARNVFMLIFCLLSNLWMCLGDLQRKYFWTILCSLRGFTLFFNQVSGFLQRCGSKWTQEISQRNTDVLNKKTFAPWCGGLYKRFRNTQWFRLLKWTFFKNALQHFRKWLQKHVRHWLRSHAQLSVVPPFETILYSTSVIGCWINVRSDVSQLIALKHVKAKQKHLKKTNLGSVLLLW